MTIKKCLAAGIAGVLLLAGAFYGLHWYRVGRFIEETDNAYIHADSVAIQPEISARITAIPVEENQRVHQGDVLVELDRTGLAARKKAAEAQVDLARSSLTKTQQQVALQQSRIKEAQSNVDSARAEEHRSLLNLKRAKKLEARKYSSTQSLQNAEADYAVAVAKRKAAEATLATQTLQLPVLKSDTDSAKAQLTQARENLADAADQLAKTVIRAPEDGVIGDLTVEAGSMVQPARTLFHLVPVPNVYVVANFKETQIGHMAIGQPVEVHVDAYPDQVFRGVVDSLSPGTGTQFSLLPQDNATGNFNKIVQKVPVRIRFTESADRLNRLRPGLSVIPAVDTRDQGEGIAYLPAHAAVGSRLADSEQTRP